GAMRPPEGIGIERRVQFFQGAVIRTAFGVLGHHGDVVVLNRSPDHVLRVHQQQTLLRLHKQLDRLRGSGLGRAKLLHELLEAVGGGNLRLQRLSRAGDGFRNARLVKWLQNIIDGVHIEGLHRVMIERRCKHHVRNAEFALDKLFQNAKAIQPRHLHIQEDKVGGMFLDEIDGVHAVLALADDVDFGKTLQQIGQFFAAGLLMIEDDGVELHRDDVISFRVRVWTFRPWTKGEVRTAQKNTKVPAGVYNREDGKKT